MEADKSSLNSVRVFLLTPNDKHHVQVLVWDDDENSARLSADGTMVAYDMVGGKKNVLLNDYHVYSDH